MHWAHLQKDNASAESTETPLSRIVAVTRTLSVCYIRS